jgi:hypothetical protein
MLKLMKRILILLVILTGVVFLALWIYSYNRTYFNDESEIGNTSGNIINGGLFCEQDGKIYFSNDFDDGSLYVMNSDLTNIKKVHHDKAAYINADENYIYYVRANNTRDNNSGSLLMFNNTGVYRINRNGDNLKSISNNPGSYLSLMGNFLYFQRYDVETGLFLYRYQIDGQLERLLLQDAVIPSAVIDNSLYYSGFTQDHNINKLDLSSFTTNTVHEGNFAYPIFMGEYIYYLDMEDNYSISRMKKDGSEVTRLVEERCSTFNITNTGKYLYYQVDDFENSKIERLNLETMEAETLLTGNYKQIHVTENYVFFKDFDNTKTYIQTADGKVDIGTFNPTVSD